MLYCYLGLYIYIFRMYSLKVNSLRTVYKYCLISTHYLVSGYVIKYVCNYYIRRTANNINIVIGGQWYWISVIVLKHPSSISPCLYGVLLPRTQSRFNAVWVHYQLHIWRLVESECFPIIYQGKTSLINVFRWVLFDQ